MCLERGKPCSVCFVTFFILFKLVFLSLNNQLLERTVCFVHFFANSLKIRNWNPSRLGWHEVNDSTCGKLSGKAHTCERTKQEKQHEVWPKRWRRRRQHHDGASKQRRFRNKMSHFPSATPSIGDQPQVLNLSNPIVNMSSDHGRFFHPVVPEVNSFFTSHICSEHSEQ